MGCLVISYTKRDVALSYKINVKLTLHFFNLFYLSTYFVSSHSIHFLFYSFLLFSMHMNVHENIF